MRDIPAVWHLEHVHRLLRRYGLFFLLRDMGTLTDDFATFVGKLAAARSPGYQLKLVNSYRLPEAR